jgi:hypothetical protein
MLMLAVGMWRCLKIVPLSRKIEDINSAKLLLRNDAMPKTGFQPISMDRFISLYLKNNPDDDRETFTACLKNALDAYQRGRTCSCGEPLWVIGSAASEYGCFSCITGEAVPDSDYEIDKACEKE